MKRVLALLLAALLLTALYACAGTENPAPQPDTPEVPETQEPPETPETTLPSGALPDPYGLGWNKPAASAMGTGGTRSGAVPGILSAAGDICDVATKEQMVDGCKIYVPTVTFKGFRNVLLQSTVESDVQATVTDLLSRRPGTADLPARIMEHSAAAADAEYYVNVIAWATGDLLCIQASGTLTINYQDSAGGWINGEQSSVYGGTLYYDLRDGHQMTLSELFSNDSDYVTLLNTAVAKKLESYDLERAFRGLPENYPLITVTPYSLLVEMTDRSPYIGSEYAYSETGTTLNLNLSDFWRDMPILWGDCTAHFEGVSIWYSAPSQYDLIISPATVTLPGGDSCQSPRIGTGVEESVGAAVNGQLQTMESGLLTEGQTWYEELKSQGADSIESWFNPEYNIAGPYLHVSYSLNMSTEDAYHQDSANAVFDLRTGAKMTLRSLLADAAAAKQALVSQGLTEDAAEAVMDGSNFVLDESLTLWGGSGEGDASVNWNLDSGYINQALFGEVTP